jgi:hypothetical protein
MAERDSEAERDIAPAWVVTAVIDVLLDAIES